MITPPEAALLGLALVAFVALSVGYALRTPIWQNPDEPAHYNYAAFVASTGGLPELQPGDWDSGLLERLKNGQLAPSDSVAAIRYESWQPPLYYLLAAPLLRAGPQDDLDGGVLRLRLLNVGLGALTLGVGWLVARELLPPLLAALTPMVMAGVPMFTAVSGAISADPLANLLAAATIWLLLVWLRPSTIGSAGWAIGVGGLIGLGVLAKVAVAMFLPLALVVLACKSRRRARDAGLLLGTCAVVMAPWLAHQVSTYGWLDPLAIRRHAAVTDQPPFPGLTAAYLGEFATTTFHSFWAQFGWMALVAPDRLYVAYGVLTLLAVLGLMGAWRNLATPPWLLVLGALGLAVAAYVAYNLSFKQFQGRYLFTALVPICVLLVAGWAALLPSRAKAWGVLLLAVGMVGLNWYALVRVLGLGFAPSG
jgi:4-amino-4-deoxy-L-arabinose transferase-like glycosyltransferase